MTQHQRPRLRHPRLRASPSRLPRPFRPNDRSKLHQVCIASAVVGMPVLIARASQGASDSRPSPPKRKATTDNSPTNPTRTSSARTTAAGMLRSQACCLCVFMSPCRQRTCRAFEGQSCRSARRALDAYAQTFAANVETRLFPGHPVIACEAQDGLNSYSTTDQYVLIVIATA